VIDWINFPPPSACRVLHCKQEKADVYIGRGSPFGNPFPMVDESDRSDVIERFRAWVKTQPELLRLIRTHLPGKSVGCFCAPRPCHGDVIDEICRGEWDHLIPPEPVFVFGSNLAGRHGKGAALSAAREYGAKPGFGRGRTGHAYALPTKDERIATRSLADVISEMQVFFDEAKGNPGTLYRFTKVGCGLAGLPEDVIREFVLSESPENVLLPGQWEVFRTPGLIRVIVAGSRDFNSYEDLRVRLDSILSRHSNIEIVSGGARGADSMGERYAIERGLLLRRIPAYWHAFNKAAGHIRNRRMAWYGTHLAAFWNGESVGTKGMIEIAVSEGLPKRVMKIS